MLGTRLKAARIRAGYSQKQLGMLVGMDEFSASARMNQYERERHSPNMRTSEQLAMVLQVPMAYLSIAPRTSWPSSSSRCPA